MKVIFLKIKLKDKEYFIIKKEDIDKENGKILSQKEKGNMYGVIVSFMKVNLRMDKFTGMEPNLTKTAIF